MRVFHLLLRGIEAALFLIFVAFATGYITMWLVMEKDMVQLPRVIGVDSTRAMELLREEGLQPKVTGKEFSELMVKEAVISQRPASGSWVKKNSEIRLVVSRGGDAVVLPNLAGLSLADAKQSLQARGLTLGRVAQAHSPTHPKGEVIAQDPEESVPIRRGSPVALLVSLGQPEEPTENLTPPRPTYQDSLGGEGAPKGIP